MPETPELIAAINADKGETGMSSDNMPIGMSGYLKKEDFLEAKILAQAAKIERLQAGLAEMTRRRNEWRAKAEGFDEIRLALREKVGEPWPPSMSRALWAGIAADEKKRADDAEARLAELEAELRQSKCEAVSYLGQLHDTQGRALAAEARVAELEALVAYIAGTNTDHVQVALAGNPNAITQVMDRARVALGGKPE